MVPGAIGWATETCTLLSFSGCCMYGCTGWPPYGAGGVAFCAELLLRQRKKIAKAAMPMTARPPTTPPTIAPTGVFEPEEGKGVGGTEDEVTGDVVEVSALGWGVATLVTVMN